MDKNNTDPKNQLRKQIKSKSNSINQNYKSKAEQHIQTVIKNLIEFKNAMTIFCFVSTNKEIDTIELIKHALKEGKRVAVPLCIAKGIMEAHEIHSLDDLIPGSYGILEPRQSTNSISSEEIQFAIIPCLSCDPFGGRLGYGGGYYDRYLYGTKFPKAAICLEKLLSPEIPMTSHDIIMDMVITEENIYKSAIK